MPNQNSYGVSGTAEPENLTEEMIERVIPTDERDLFREIDPEIFINELCQRIDRDNEFPDRTRQCDWVRKRLYVDGWQHGIVNGESKMWEPFDYNTLSSPDERSMFLVVNKIGPHTRTLLKEYIRSNPNLRSEGSSDDLSATLAASHADKLGTYWDNRWIPTNTDLLEGNLALVNGNYIYKLTWVKGGGGPYISTQYDKKIIDYGKGAYQCPDCKQSGDISDLPAEATPDENNLIHTACPHCKDAGPMMATPVQSPQPSMMPATREEIELGHPELELIDPLEISMHTRGVRNIYDAPTMKRTRALIREIIKDAYKWAVIGQGTDLSISSRYAIQLEALSGGGQSPSEFYGGGGASQLVGTLSELKEYWVKPLMYSDVKTDREVTWYSHLYPKGKTYPAGTKLIDEFPDGMCIVRLGNDTLEIRNEDKNKLFTHGVFTTSINSVWGNAAIHDMIPGQNLRNDATSMAMINLIYNAQPHYVYNSQILDPMQVTGDGRWHPTINMSVGEDFDIRKGFAVMEGLTIQGGITEIVEDTDNNLREQSGAFPTVSGLNDPNVGTATGMSIARDQQVALMGPPLKRRAESVLVERRYQVLELYQKNLKNIPGAMKSVLGKYDDMEAEAFFNCDIRKDIKITAEEGSWLPRTDMEERANVLSAATFAGLPGGIFNPELQPLLEWGMQAFHIPASLDPHSPDRRNCERRIINLKKFLAQESLPPHGQIPLGLKAPPPPPPQAPLQPGQVPPPQPPPTDAELAWDNAFTLAMAQFPMDPPIDDAPTFIKVIIDYLKEDEGQNCEEVMKAVLLNVMEQYKNFAIQNQVGEMQRSAPLAAAQGQVQQLAAPAPPQPEGKQPPGPGMPVGMPASGSKKVAQPPARNAA